MSKIGSKLWTKPGVDRKRPGKPGPKPQGPEGKKPGPHRPGPHRPSPRPDDKSDPGEKRPLPHPFPRPDDKNGPVEKRPLPQPFPRPDDNNKVPLPWPRPLPGPDKPWDRTIPPDRVELPDHRWPRIPHDKIDISLKDIGEKVGDGFKDHLNSLTEAWGF